MCVLFLATKRARANRIRICVFDVFVRVGDLVTITVSLVSIPLSHPHCLLFVCTSPLPIPLFHQPRQLYLPDARHTRIDVAAAANRAAADIAAVAAACLVVFDPPLNSRCFIPSLVMITILHDIKTFVANFRSDRRHRRQCRRCHNHHIAICNAAMQLFLFACLVSYFIVFLFSFFDYFI